MRIRAGMENAMAPSKIERFKNQSQNEIGRTRGSDERDYHDSREKQTQEGQRYEDRRLRKSRG